MRMCFKTGSLAPPIAWAHAGLHSRLSMPAARKNPTKFVCQLSVFSLHRAPQTLPTKPPPARQLSDRPSSLTPLTQNKPVADAPHTVAAENNRHSPQLLQPRPDDPKMSQHDETHTHSHDGHLHSMLSHLHSHHQPNELLTGGVLSNPAVRITWIGLLVNVGMAASKGVGGVYFHSQALVADAIHLVSDMVADFLTLATVNVAQRVGTPTRFPLGYGKIETVGSFLVSGVLLFAGVSVGWLSMLQIFEYTLPTYIYEYILMVQVGHSHSHGSLMEQSTHSHSHLGEETQLSPRQVPNINAAWLAGGSIIVKELLFRKTLSVAEATNSKVLVANAWHHRVDLLTAFVALLTVAGGVFFNIAWLDLVGGVCVSLLIIKAGWGTFKASWFELVDRGEAKESEFYEKVKTIVDTEVESVSKGGFSLSELSVLTSGANTNVYATLETKKKGYTLEELNRIETSLVDAIRRDDKFVRKIFVKFEEQKTKKDDEHLHHH